MEDLNETGTIQERRAAQPEAWAKAQAQARQAREAVDRKNPILILSPCGDYLRWDHPNVKWVTATEKEIRQWQAGIDALDALAARRIGAQQNRAAEIAIIVEDLHRG